MTTVVPMEESMTTTKTPCRRCGGPIPALPGQPSGRTFCSVACRTRAKADAARRLLHAITHPDTEADR